MTFYKKIYLSPLGEISLVAEESSLVGVWFVGQKYFERGLFEPILLKSNDILEETALLLDAYFSGKKVDFSVLPLYPSGSDFQQRVWSCLKTIPYGQTMTYGEIAKELKCQSTQAVGGAVSKNTWSIVVPCHRVIGSKKQLTGYAGGLEKKIWLLEHETALSDNLAKTKKD